MNMKKYSKPVTAMLLLAPHTYVCGVTSVITGEQPEGSAQLAPGRNFEIIE